MNSGVCCSNFTEIFDVDQFISFLSKDVKIIKELPTKGGKALTPYTMRIPRKCNPKCYEKRVLPVLNKKHVSVQSLTESCESYTQLKCHCHALCSRI